ncbi:MAG: hypothetical protein PHI38_05110 [Sulfurimonas sp.]|nr:hypothetical protein [Sulfurimonas sp.]
MAIIAMFLLSLNGCGYKANPYYLEDAPKGDDNVKFIIKQPHSDNNESDITNR